MISTREETGDWCRWLRQGEKGPKQIIRQVDTIVPVPALQMEGWRALGLAVTHDDYHVESFLSSSKNLEMFYKH